MMKSYVSDPGVSCLPTATLKLSQDDMLACKQDKMSGLRGSRQPPGLTTTCNWNLANASLMGIKIVQLLNFSGSKGGLTIFPYNGHSQGLPTQALSVSQLLPLHKALYLLCIAPAVPIGVSSSLILNN